MDVYLCWPICQCVLMCLDRYNTSEADLERYIFLSDRPNTKRTLDVAEAGLKIVVFGANREVAAE